MDPGRRNVLRGRLPATPPPLRPPAALPESTFTDACTSCGACVDACPENIVVAGSGGYPEIDFTRGECTFCGQCIDACEPQALQQNQPVTLDVNVTIGDHCLARKNVVCQACGDACEVQAIRFPPRLGAVATPVIDNESCTGCGACVAVCPENAVNVAVRG